MAEENFDIGDPKNLVSKEEEEALMEGLADPGYTITEQHPVEQPGIGYLSQRPDDLMVMSRGDLESTERMYFRRGLLIGSIGTGALVTAGYYLSQLLK